MKIETINEANSILRDLYDLETLIKCKGDIKIEVTHNRYYADSLGDRLSAETLKVIEKKKGEIYNLIVSDLTQQRDALNAKLEAL